MMAVKVSHFALALCLLYLAFILTAAAQERAASAPPAPAQPVHSLQELVNEAARTALTRFANRDLREENLAITLIDLRDPQRPVQASFRGDERIYPASVVKLFYLVAAHRWLEDGKLKDSEELRRAMRDMIVESSNDATHYILDLLTDTTSGPELPPAEMQEWAMKRNAVNRYFVSLGYQNINVNQKPWCEGPYGRDRLFLGEKYENRNKLTTSATARLMTEIVIGKTVTPARSAAMMGLLKRDFTGKSNDPDDQEHGFTGMALSAGMRLWSKAGWTSATRHDAAYIELPNGARFVLVTFTTDHANEREIIPAIARVVIAGLGSIK
jgi:beta-lactamase class A